MRFASIPDVLEELKKGRPVVLVDDPDRENEGDIVVAAEKVTPELVNFMLTHARGWICLALTEDKADELELPLQASHNTSPRRTAFTVSIDALEGTTTGVSAHDRVRTILTAIKDGCKPEELARPGHVSPLRAKNGGVLVRTGHTEASVDLCQLAGLKPFGVICEIMNSDGTMARLPDLEGYCQEHGFLLCSIADVVKFRHTQEKLVQRLVKVDLPTRIGGFDLCLYHSRVDRLNHVVLSKGLEFKADDESVLPLSATDEPVLVRVHSECMTSDIFGSIRCDCGAQKDEALRRISEADRGVFLYMRQEGRGIGLHNKLRAYELQDSGMDTVDANLALGFPADRRDYGIGMQILRDIGVRKMRLITNNPAKRAGLEAYGLEVVERVSIETEPNPHNVRYLDTKRQRMGHLLDGLESLSSAGTS